MDTHLNFIQKALQAIGKFLGLIKKEATNVLSVADKIVNALKAFDGTPAGQFIEGIAELYVPAPLVNAFKLWFPVVVKDLNWTKGELGKTTEQEAEDALTYISKITGDTKAVQLNSLQALVAKWLADNADTPINLPIQQALTAAQVVHDPTLVAGS